MDLTTSSTLKLLYEETVDKVLQFQSLKSMKGGGFGLTARDGKYLRGFPF